MLPTGAAATTARAGERPWRLEYLLQATDDPSLLVPVEDVWRHRGQTARFLTRRFDQPQERVLAALGRASRVFPPIEGSLRTARPEACALSTREAADLVRDKALLLKASGFGVLLPGLDTRLNVRLRLRGARARRTRRRPTARACSASTAWSATTGSSSLGDQPLTREEFEMLAQLKEPLVQLRGRWVDVRPDQIERALAFIQKHQNGREMQLAEALSTALAPTTLDGVHVAEVEASGWIEALLEDVRQGARAEEVPDKPDGFRRHPAPLPEARRRLASHPPALQPRRPAGRRHGAGEAAIPGHTSPDAKGLEADGRHTGWRRGRERGRGQLTRYRCVPAG